MFSLGAEGLGSLGFGVLRVQGLGSLGLSK